MKILVKGNSFGLWTVLGPNERRAVGTKGTIKIYYLCACQCGVERWHHRNTLETGHSVSCAKCRWLGICPPGQTAPRRLLRNYKRKAHDRNLAWNLSEEEFFFLVTASCHYCGLPPSNVCKARSGTRSHSADYVREEYVYSGIDRKDNSTGYEIDNCVSCCRDCNHAKHTKPYDVFKAWIDRVMKFQETARIASFQAEDNGGSQD